MNTYQLIEQLSKVLSEDLVKNKGERVENKEREWMIFDLISLLNNMKEYYK